MTGFYKGKPITDGRYAVIIRWKKGCNIDGYDYTTDVMDFICGSWYEFSQGEDGQIVTTIDGGIDYKIIGWREIPTETRPILN